MAGFLCQRCPHSFSSIGIDRQITTSKLKSFTYGRAGHTHTLTHETDVPRPGELQNVSRKGLWRRRGEGTDGPTSTLLTVVLVVDHPGIISVNRDQSSVSYAFFPSGRIPVAVSSLSEWPCLTLYLFLGILPSEADQHKSPLAADHTAHHPITGSVPERCQRERPHRPKREGETKERKRNNGMAQSINPFPLPPPWRL
ncbi:hypothetical protein An12g08200 [Aspergillus niger]|uniref:Uncharacterized protein n=2 Tax=Aspergillus niger TaxID=5061 RepID=A2R0D2_ASPNC|nr:hypothetical protein An12g08200 [Aspergillus niger]CAK41270.1 hypothetical protein An12g08200 [Aspergillus niger]